MSGIASLFGGNSAKTDRKQELDARDNTRQVFGYALPTSKQADTQGAANLGTAGDYFNGLLRADRTQTTQNAAPAINTELSAEDAAKRREAITGTGRTGGTAEANRMQDATSTGKVADIVNKTQLADKQIGAQGTESVGNDQIRRSLGLMGLSEQAINSLLNNTMQSRTDSQAIHNDSFDRAGTDIGNIVANFM